MRARSRSIVLLHLGIFHSNSTSGRFTVRGKLIFTLCQWIRFVDGVVIASGSSPVTVFHAAETSGRHPFFIYVGREEEPCRIRHASFGYNRLRKSFS